MTIINKFQNFIELGSPMEHPRFYDNDPPNLHLGCQTSLFGPLEKVPFRHSKARARSAPVSNAPEPFLKSSVRFRKRWYSLARRASWVTQSRNRGH